MIRSSGTPRGHEPPEGQAGRHPGQTHDHGLPGRQLPAQDEPSIRRRSDCRLRSGAVRQGQRRIAGRGCGAGFVVPPSRSEARPRQFAFSAVSTLISTRRFLLWLTRIDRAVPAHAIDVEPIAIKIGVLLAAELP